MAGKYTNMEITMPFNKKIKPRKILENSNTYNGIVSYITCLERLDK